MSLYERLVGPSWGELPRSLRELYGAETPTSARGSFKVERGSGLLARIAASVAGLPEAGDDVPTEIDVTPLPDGARWERRFGGTLLATDQRERDGLMVERVGPLEYAFALRVDGGALVFDQRRVALALGPLTLPLPRALQGKVEGRAFEDAGGAIHTEVSVRVPLVGLLVRYTGAIVP